MGIIEGIISKKSRFAEIGLVLLAIYFYIFGSAQYSFSESNILLINGVIFTIFLAVYLIKSSKEGSPVDLPMLVCIGVMILSTVFSIDPRRSIGELWLFCIDFFLFILVANVVRNGISQKRIVNSVLIAGGLVMLLSLSEAVQWYFEWIKANPSVWIPQIPFRLPAPNFLSAVVNVWIFMAAARLWHEKSNHKKVLFGFYIITAFIVLYLTASRGGMVATMVGFASFLPVAIYLYPEKWLQIWKKLISKKILLTILIILVLISLIAAAGLMIRIGRQPGHDNNFSTRSKLWSAAWHQFTQSPLLGSGLFTMTSQYLQEQSSPPGVFFDYSHNIYLDLLSGCGIIGLAAFGWLLFELVRGLIKRLKIAHPEERAVIIGVLAAMAAFMVHGLIDSIHHSVPTSAWNMAILLGAAYGHVERKEKRRMGLVAIIGVMVVAGFWVRLYAINPLNAGVEAANKGDWETASELFIEATERDPGMAITHQQLGYAYGVLAEQTGDPAYLQLGIDAFMDAVEVDPYWGLNYANMGALYLAQGDLEEARIEFKKAVDLAPAAGVFAYNLGLVLEELQEFDAAEDAYRIVFGTRGDWINAHFWRSDDFREDVKAEWYKEYLLEQSQKEAPKPILPSSASAYLSEAWKSFDEGEITEARGYFNKAVGISSNVNYQWLKAEFAALDGDYEQAIRSGENVLDAVRNQGARGIGITFNQPYAVFIFRSQAVNMDMVPQMLQIPINDSWALRFLSLVDWYEENGEIELAEGLRAELLLAVPDLEELKLDAQ